MFGSNALLLNKKVALKRWNKLGIFQYTIGDGENVLLIMMFYAITQTRPQLGDKSAYS